MYDFFAQASSLHTNEQARAIKFYVEPSSVQLNRASILELSVHSKCPVGTARFDDARKASFGPIQKANRRKS
jgi:hypothetical protein